MYMKRAFLVLTMCLLSAFAHASVIDVPVEAQFELSQDPIDLDVQSANDISFELVAAHSKSSLQVEYGEAIKLERSIKPAFVLTTEHQVLNLSNEVGWRRSYNL